MLFCDSFLSVVGNILSFPSWKHLCKCCCIKSYLNTWVSGLMPLTRQVANARTNNPQSHKPDCCWTCGYFNKIISFPFVWSIELIWSFKDDPAPEYKLSCTKTSPQLAAMVLIVSQWQDALLRTWMKSPFCTLKAHLCPKQGCWNPFFNTCCPADIIKSCIQAVGCKIICLSATERDTSPTWIHLLVLVVGRLSEFQVEV